MQRLSSCQSLGGPDGCWQKIGGNSSLKSFGFPIHALFLSLLCVHVQVDFGGGTFSGLFSVELKTHEARPTGDRVIVFSTDKLMRKNMQRIGSRLISETRCTNLICRRETIIESFILFFRDTKILCSFQKDSADGPFLWASAMGVA